MKIQTKAIAESNRLVSAHLSSLEEFISGTGNDSDGDDASGGTGSSSLNETNMANFIGPHQKVDNSRCSRPYCCISYCFSSFLFKDFVVEGCISFYINFQIKEEG
jgi:hypothetical protein